jgi:hypothetical protein
LLLKISPDCYPAYREVAVNDWLKEKDSLQLGSLMGPEESTVTPEQIISDSARTAIPPAVNGSGRKIGNRNRKRVIKSA